MIEGGFDAKPGKREIQAQTHRLLESRRFLNSPSQAALLEVIMQSHLAGEALDGKTIGKRTFPNYVPGNSSDVRITAFNLRESLADYYKDEGSHDPVIIEVLKGKNYPAKADYNPKADAVKHYASALACMANVNSYPWKVVNSLGFCQMAMEADPSFAPAYSLFSEFALCFASNRRGDITEFGFGPYKGKRKLRQDIGLAREYAIRSVLLNRNHWRGYVALGAYRACCSRWEAAERAFAKAMKLDPDQTSSDPWYCFYLVAVGKGEEALETAYKKYEETPCTSFWATLAALFHYAMGQRKEAENCILYAINSNKTAYLTHAVKGLLLLEHGNAAKVAVKGFDWLFKKHRVELEFNPIASFGLWALFCGRAGYAKRADALIDHLRSYPKSIYNSDAFEGVQAFPLATRDTPPIVYDYVNFQLEVVRFIESVESGPADTSICPWELALAYVGRGPHWKAMEELRRAQAEHHPVMMWVHLWPFLRLLYRQPDFVPLVANMALPIAIGRNDEQEED